jgi:hypothetical protein
LAVVWLGELPQDQQLAALMKLFGAYTPRRVHNIGLGEKDPAEESDKLVGIDEEANRAWGDATVLRGTPHPFNVVVRRELLCHKEVL